MAEFEIQEGLPKPGEQYEFTAHELQEFIKCANDPVYFIRNYMKIIQVDRGLVPFDMYDFQEEMIRNYHENRFCITMCSRQVGKALDINTEILTANGWKRMLDVHPGDQVYTPKGTLTEVIAESPIFTDHDVFAVKFDTGDVIRADRDHLWTVECQEDLEWITKTVTTKQLQEWNDQQKHIRIRCTQPIDSHTKSEARECLSALISRYGQRQRNKVSIVIPEELKLEDVQDLLWGMGIKHTLQSRTISYTDNDCYWYVKSVEQIESIPVKCISVADDDHLFLCGRQLIPTHNSTTVIGYFLHYIIFNLNVRVCISANKQKTAVDLLGKLKLAYENLPRFLQHGVTRWARLEIELSNGSSIFAAATSSSAVRGGSYNCIAGTSVVTIMLNGKIYNIGIKTLYQCIANSSNSKKTLNTSDVLLEDIDGFIFEQQIHQMLRTVDGKTKNESCQFYGEIYDQPTSCYSNLFGRGRSWRTNNIDNSRAFIGPSSSTIYGGFSQTPSSSTICIYENVDRQSRANVQVISNATNAMCSTTFRSPTTAQTRIEAYRRNETKNWQCTSRKKIIDAHTTTYEPIADGQVQGNSSKQGILPKNFFGQKRQTCSVDAASESRPTKNSQDRRETSWNETDSRTAQTNGSQAWVCGMESRLEDDTRTEKEYGKTEIKILSERGFTKFDGVKCTRAQQTIRLLFDNGAWIECTPDHNIYLTSGKKIAAIDSLNRVIVGHEKNHVRVIGIVDSGIQDVYDMLNVDETHNFYANGILVSNCLLVDEFAFVPPNIADEFYASTFPTITSGKTTKIIMVSTPNGMNLFHRFWVDAQANRNDFVPQFVHWSQVPGRDEQWKLDTIRNIGGPEKFAQEYECVGPDTLVTVRDVVTGNIQLIRIEDVYACL